jgi:hypothetical protein
MFSNEKGSQMAQSHTVAQPQPHRFSKYTHVLKHISLVAHRFNKHTGSKNDISSQIFFIFIGINFFAAAIFFLGVPLLALGDPSVGWTSVPSPIKNAKRLEKNE